ncbi:MAG: hypothetical protein FRX49_01564 [Trebouxia sp. A1-2]|nr:MAG: hypothetical protein FRX49_01564 [Trebouxia sp. A1-2]
MSSSGQDLASAPADASAPSSTVATLAAQLANTVSVSDAPFGSADAAGTSASAGAALPLYTPISGSAPVKYTTAFQSRIVDCLNQIGAVVNNLSSANALRQAGLDARFSGFEAALASQEAVSLGNYSSLEGKLTRLTDHLLPAQGPTDLAGVRAAVADDSATRASLGTFGPEWLYSVREVIPMEVMVKLPVLEALTAVAKAAQASALLPPTSPASISAPSTTASLGKHFKADLPRPEYFRQLDSSADISRWLLRMEEYLTLMNYDPSIWSVVATQFLGRAPRDLWDSFKAENGLVTAYPWPEFKAWCIATFNLHDMEKQALTKLMTLRQTASVAEYKADHDVLAAKSKLPTAQRLIYWEQGLKPEIRAECKLDPLTHTAYANLAAAQTAALAIDSHFSSVASGKKRSVPTAATATVSSSKKPKTDHEQSPTVAWSINGTKFHCARNGVMQLPVPQFFTEWISSLPKVNGKSHLPREHFASGVSMPTCFAKGCGQTHAWTRCPTLAHTIWDSRSTQPALSGHSFTLDAAASNSGDFQGDAAQLEAPVLLDSGASSNFVSPRLLQQLAITYNSSSAKLRLANDSEAPILGKV